MIDGAVTHMADYSLDFTVRHDLEKGSCTIRFRCFDTPNSVTVYGTLPPDVLEGLLLGIRRSCLEYHRLWSFTSPESDIARINQDVERVAVDSRTTDLLKAMASFSSSEPLFDFTIGPVSLAWKKAQLIPTDDELSDALSHVGVSKLAIEDGVVAKADPLSRVDVGGAAKGFVADEIAIMLRLAGVKSADIDLGGNLYLLGSHPEGRPWRLAVRIPEGVPAERILVEVRDKSAVTSGSYERFVEIEGKRYQHIIDPTTGWPSESDIVSATVIAKSSLQADMLATTACLAGSTGLEGLANRHPDCSFIAILADGTVLRPVQSA